MLYLKKDYAILSTRAHLGKEIISNEFGSWLERERKIDEVRPWVWVIVKFLQDNNLTTRTLAKTPEDIDEKFEIRVSDLTQEGHEFMKTGYQKWLTALDRGIKPEKIDILEKWLKKLRAGEVKPKVPCTDDACMPLHQKR